MHSLLDAHADPDPEARCQLCVPCLRPSSPSWSLTRRPCTPTDYVADYENPISPEILRAVNGRVVAGDKNDHLLLPPEVRPAFRITVHSRVSNTDSLTSLAGRGGWRLRDAAAARGDGHRDGSSSFLLALLARPGTRRSRSSHHRAVHPRVAERASPAATRPARRVPLERVLRPARAP